MRSSIPTTSPPKHPFGWLLDSWLSRFLFPGGRVDAELLVPLGLTSFVATFGAVMTMPFLVLHAASGLATTALGDAAAIVPLLLVLFLIRRGHHQAARLSLVVTAQIEIVVFSILYGSGSGIENFLVASALAPFVLFTPHERRYLIGSLACTSLALAITCAAAALEVPGILLLDKSLRESMKMIYLTSTSALVALLGWALFLLQSHKQATLEKVSLLNAQTANLASLGEMASNIAHEIASPIAAIELQTLLLSRQREGDEQVTAACQRISGICARITTIVKAIRSLSRKSQDDPHRAIDPAEAVEMAVSLCRERFKQGSVTLDVDCPVAPRLSSATRRSCHRSS